MSNIKAIISDVDGVMVGKRDGFNFPLPHKEVLSKLEHTSAHGIPIVLCTAKFGFAIKQIAVQAKLHNPHITDGGAVVIDWLAGKIISQQSIDKGTVAACLKSSLEQNIYTELYTANTYFVQASQNSDFTERRSRVLQASPKIVESLVSIAQTQDIIKIINFSEGERDIPKLEANVEKLSGAVNYIWTQHPFLKPRRPMVITAPGVSKQHAVQEVADYLEIPFSSILGIGDSEADWSFMQLCGYVATIGEDGGRLQELSRAKGEGQYYLAKPVDDHGLLEAMRYFGV